MNIRKGTIEDLKELQTLFATTINQVCKKDYNKQQIDVWTSSIHNQEYWIEILRHQHVLIAQNQEQIIGYCTLKNGNHIDHLFVHKDFQRQGIALNLYNAIENEAKNLQQTKLAADVSLTAKAFFKNMGFKILKEQKVLKKGVELINFKMERIL